MSGLWIVHRDARQRAAIARLAGAAPDAVLGSPGDPRFDAAPPAEVVVLGLAGDFEAELQFAHRASPRLAGAGWILLPQRGSVARARRLFDAIDAEVLGYPPDARTLRWRIRSAPARRGATPPSLSQRAARDALTERFARWFADLDLPDSLRALDPRLAQVPVLVRGEPGTGRGLLVRYLHAFGGNAEGALIRVPCSPQSGSAELQAAIAPRARTRRALSGCCLWLEGPEQLPPSVQRELRDWIELTPPEGLLHSYRVRWIATVGDDALEPDAEPVARLEPALARALSGLWVRIPPLRERRALVAPLVRDTAAAWCRDRALRPRQLDPAALAVLEEHPWPGNVAELEAVVVQSLSGSDADPLCASDLRYGGEPFLPPEAAAGIGTPPGGAPGATPADDDVIPVEAILVEPPTDAEAPPADPGDAPAPPEPHPGPGPAPTPHSDRVALSRLAGAVAHAVRNPLASVQTFAELLPSHYDDPDFRTRFAQVVKGDVSRIARAVERLERIARLETPAREPVDVAGLLDRLLEARRQVIRQRRLIVLKELDQDRPLALGDPEQLHAAFEALIDEVLSLVPDRGDVYFASRHHAGGLPGGASLRILVRCRRSRTAPLAPLPEVSAASASLSLAIAESIVRAHGGAFAIDAVETGETVIVLDLPAP